MRRAERQQAIQAFQTAREGRLALTYITSTRANLEIQIGDDILPIFYEHLEAGRETAKNGVDLFIHSNGGSGTVPWRLVNLIREYTKHFTVAVPHKAFSAATLIALGADEILMHRMGCLGPIDPSVTNAFNPPNPQNPSQLAAISVEDVTAYFKLVKDEVGIHHEDELIQSLKALTDKIHPLSLGNVQRSHNQSRMIARKLLKLHMKPEHEHEIASIIDNLKSNLFFHGHPINRTEAKNDLNLKVAFADDELERRMWSLYSEYDREMLLAQPLNFIHEYDVRSRAQQVERAQHALRAEQAAKAVPIALAAMQAAQQAAQQAPDDEAAKQTFQQALQAFQQAAQEAQQAAALPGDGRIKVVLDRLPGAYIESVGRTDVFLTDMSVERLTAQTQIGPQDLIKQEVLWQRWETEN